MKNIAKLIEKNRIVIIIITFIVMGVTVALIDLLQNNMLELFVNANQNERVKN